MRPHFVLLGFPVRIGTSAAVFIALSYLLAGLSGLAVIGAFMGSILLHELGHAFAFRHYGCRSAITLHGFGGMTESYDAHGLTHRQHIAVSLAGPLAQLLLLGLPMLAVMLFATIPAETTDLIALLVYVNIGWALVNLLPLYPLDGGHVLYRFLAHRNVRRAWGITVGVTLAVALPAMAFAFANGLRVAVLVIGYAVWQGLSGREPITTSNPIRDAAARARQHHRPMKTGGRNGDALVREAYVRLAEGNDRRVAVLLDALDADRKRRTDAATIRRWQTAISGGAADAGDDLLGATVADPVDLVRLARLVDTTVDDARLPAAIALLDRRGLLGEVLQHMADEEGLRLLEDRLLRDGLASAQMAVARELRLRSEAADQA